MIYKDSTRPIEERIKDLLSRMTIEEKFDQISQDMSKIDYSKLSEEDAAYLKEAMPKRRMDGKTRNILQRYAVEHTRLGVPFFFNAEALHGLSHAGATIYPQQMTLGQTFEPRLAYRMGRGIATEARSLGIHETWNPVLDLARDPRWGRTEETYGEDTYLSSEMGVQVVKGLQGEGLDKPDAVASELKHYTGYGNPVGGLNCAPSTMGRHDVYAYAMPVFEKAIREGKATNVMASYNSIDGVPVISDHEILTDILRDQWGMPGFVRADMTAIIMQHTAHYSAATPKEALAKAVKAGVDLQLADYSQEDYRRYFTELIEEGTLSMEDLDQSVARMLRVKFMLGLFENPYVDESLSAKVLRCEEHLKDSLEIARRGAVLLKNEENLLPLSKKLKKIAVVGPTAARPALGDYTRDPKGFSAITLLDGIKQVVSDETEVVYAQGCNILGSGIKPLSRWNVMAYPVEGIISPHDFGWTAEYYNGPDFSGEPVLVRLDKQINFNWIYAAPDDVVDQNCFCVRWRARLRIEKSFKGRIGLSSNDSMRLYVDGNLLIDGWDGKNANVMLPFDFVAGEPREICVEFRNDARAARVIFGYDHGEEDMDSAVKICEDADVIIAALGDSEETSGENFDRTDLNFPGRQLEFLKKLHATGKPVVLVVNTGRSMSLTWENENIPAILQAGFNGDHGGLAAAEILFGDVAPSGRLTLSYPRTVGQVPCHYSRHPAGGRLYVECDWSPLYPFGYGLTYTSFAYSNLKLSAHEIGVDGSVEVSVDVTNTGDRFGEEVVQVYVNDCFSSVVKPLQELKAFEKVALNPKETKTLTFTLGEEAWRTLDAKLKWVVEPGDFEIRVGKSAEDILLTDTVTIK